MAVGLGDLRRSQQRVRNVRNMSAENPYRRWWETLDEGRQAMAVDVWRDNDFEALHDLLPPEHRHGGSDTWVDFAKVEWLNTPDDGEICWVITDDDLQRFMTARYGETLLGRDLDDFAEARGLSDEPDHD